MKIYLAGKYSGDNIIDILSNIRQGIAATAELMRRGHSVYCPFLDFLIALIPGPTIPKEVYQQNSLSFVDWCDALYLLPGWEKSKGVKRERERARDLGKEIHIFTSCHERWTGRWVHHCSACCRSFQTPGGVL